MERIIFVALLAISLTSFAGKKKAYFFCQCR